MATTACFVIVGKNDSPIYESEVGSGPRKDEAAHLHQFVLHASMDIVQDVVWTTQNMYLKVVDKFGDLFVSTYVTAGQAKLMLLHDLKSEDGIKNFFQEVHELYIKILLNPLYVPGSKITSPQFDARVRMLAKKYL
ncbi:trafficking protein particle complex subunit [Klebsormidium nitens]|uniref:Trafficking protein particle complex subunit n=1 Tax=Klebsormidium nitens TaxID=105231 RepID=A0A1Y1IAY5_KLENI|nr:trafficking protein particle complex subunit [Klebsormidium nitens]|eukprot:GAQ85877.1 trafficking protein particle complex subunit [Klebsormidium nitens]